MQNHNTIYIVGAGAIGKALAVFLQLAGKNVIILRGSVDNGCDYYEKLSVELNDATIVEATVKVSTISNYKTLNGIVVLTNKSYGNQQLAEKLQSKIKHFPLVILQNGLAIEQPFMDVGFSEIYRCVLYTTSQLTTTNTIRFKPVAASCIGIIKGNMDSLFGIVGELHNAYFEFKAEEDIQPVIWTKTIINSVFNAVCPLLETDNGIFHRNKNALEIARRLIASCITIARVKGILLTEEKLMEGLLQISRFSDGQLISTYQDIQQKRRTEIDTLNFAIVAIAAAQNMSDVVVETKLLGELIRLKSDLLMHAVG